MTDFEYDCYQRKQLTYGARHRVNGSKSRKCPMSTDHMTQKQWRERNGAVVTVSMKEPMTWSKFITLSKTMQEDYIRALQNDFGATGQQFIQMFKISNKTFYNYLRDHDLNITFKPGKKMTKSQREVWEYFINRNEDTASQSKEKSKKEKVAEDLTAPPSEDKKVSTDTIIPESNSSNISNIPSRDGSMRMDTFSLKFTGTIDVDMIANSLRSMLGSNSAGTVEINFSLL